MKINFHDINIHMDALLERFNYEIDYAWKNRTEGTNEKPLLIGITSGNKTSQSIVFHFKIGNYYHDMTIKKVNSKTVNLICRDTYCKATCKLAIDPKFKLWQNLFQTSPVLFQLPFLHPLS